MTAGNVDCRGGRQLSGDARSYSEDLRTPDICARDVLGWQGLQPRPPQDSLIPAPPISVHELGAFDSSDWRWEHRGRRSNS